MFKTHTKNAIIGVVHFPPLLGFPGCPGLRVALRNATQDLFAFERGGANAIIIENNYDLPHKEFVSQETIASMSVLGLQLRHQTKLPLGVSVLWNDYRAALSIAKSIHADFIRIPVFVDTVKTHYGIIKGSPKEVIKYRKTIRAENIKILTDIHVKHAVTLSPHTLIQSAKRAIQLGSDGLIITGKWTGAAPGLDELEIVRKHVGKFPIFAGSGVDIENIQTILSYCNGVIVSTSLKQGSENNREVNIKTWKQRISQKKVRALQKALK